MLFIWKAGLEKERDIFQLLINSPNGHGGWDTARLNPGSKSPKHLDYPLPLSQASYQGAGLEGEQPRQEQMPILDAAAAGRSLIHNATALTLFPHNLQECPLTAHKYMFKSKGVIPACSKIKIFL